MLPAGSGFSCSGSGGNNTFVVIGTPGSEAIGVNAGNMTMGSYTAAYSNVQTMIVNPLFGETTLCVPAGLTVYLPNASVGGGIFTLALPSLVLAANSKLVVPTDPNHADREAGFSLRTGLCWIRFIADG